MASRSSLIRSEMRTRHLTVLLVSVLIWIIRQEYFLDLGQSKMVSYGVRIYQQVNGYRDQIVHRISI